MSEIKKQLEERISIYDDIYSYRIPKRVPVDSFRMTHQMLSQYAGLDPVEVQFDFGRLKDTARDVAGLIKSDTCPIQGASLGGRLPSYYQILGAETFKMGGNGCVQHPEVAGMLPEDYEALIEDPFACIMERIIPRLYKAFDPADPVRIAKAVHMAKASVDEDRNAILPILKELSEIYGYYPGAPRGSMGMTTAPFDFLADQLRGFSNISVDIRRDRKKVAEACEALYPLNLKMAMPEKPSHLGFVGTPLHMPVYMREKDFVEVWLPTYKRMLEQLASQNVRVSAFCEGDWMRYLDILQSEIPAGTVLQFEYGDPQTIKDKLGKKFIIKGLYPLSLIKTGTKQECIDKAKEILDIMMPGGGYFFAFDKSPIMLKDINLENYIALAEFIQEYAVYPDAGKEATIPLNTENFESKPVEVKSKYLFDWEAFKTEYPYTPDFARERFERYDDEMFKVFMNMLV